MIDAGEIQRNARKFCCQPLAFEWRRNFGVDKNDTVGKAAIRNQRTKAIHEQFETLRFFVVGDGYVVEVQAHGSHRSFAGLFIPEIAERAGRALVDLLDDAVASRAVHVDPRASADVEYFAEALHTLGGVNADAGYPDDGDFAVRVGLFGFAHKDLRVTGQVYQGFWKNYGAEESGGSLLKRRASSA